MYAGLWASAVGFWLVIWLAMLGAFYRWLFFVLFWGSVDNLAPPAWVGVSWVEGSMFACNIRA